MEQFWEQNQISVTGRRESFDNVSTKIRKLRLIDKDKLSVEVKVFDPKTYCENYPLLVFPLLVFKNASLISIEKKKISKFWKVFEGLFCLLNDAAEILAIKVNQNWMKHCQSFFLKEWESWKSCFASRKRKVPRVALEKREHFSFFNLFSSCVTFEFFEKTIFGRLFEFEKHDAAIAFIYSNKNFAQLLSQNWVKWLLNFLTFGAKTGDFWTFLLVYTKQKLCCRKTNWRTWSSLKHPPLNVLSNRSSNAQMLAKYSGLLKLYVNKPTNFWKIFIEIMQNHLLYPNNPWLSATRMSTKLTA